MSTIGYVNSANNVNSTGNTAAQAAQNQKKDDQLLKTEEKKTESGVEVAEDEFIKSTDEQAKSPTYSKPTVKPDYDKINELKADMKNNIGAFKKMAESMIRADKETGFFPDPTNTEQLRDWVAGVASGRITYDADTINQAKEAVSEDGYWGAEAVSDRIVEFAKAISGGDIEQYDKLVDAIKKGFGDAKEAWGKEMPEITKQTYDKTMEKMDAWKKEVSTATTTNTQDAVNATTGVAKG